MLFISRGWELIRVGSETDGAQYRATLKEKVPICKRLETEAEVHLLTGERKFHFETPQIVEKFKGGEYYRQFKALQSYTHVHKMQFLVLYNSVIWCPKLFCDWHLFYR